MRLQQKEHEHKAAALNTKSQHSWHRHSRRTGGVEESTVLEIRESILAPLFYLALHTMVITSIFPRAAFKFLI